MIGSLNEYAYIEVTKAIVKWRTTLFLQGIIYHKLLNCTVVLFSVDSKT